MSEGEVEGSSHLPGLDAAHGPAEPLNEVFENIYRRRSVRSYSPDDVPDSVLLEIIKAGTYAPSAVNEQPWRFAVIKNRDLISKYSSMAIRSWVEQCRGSDSPALRGLAERVSSPGFSIFYNAPVVVMIFSRSNSLYPHVDSALAAENMMLAARSLGIGSCWIGMAMPLGSDEVFLKEVGAPEGYELSSTLIFGYPARTEAEPPERESDVIVSWVL